MEPDDLEECFESNSGYAKLMDSVDLNKVCSQDFARQRDSALMAYIERGMSWCKPPHLKKSVVEEVHGESGRVPNIIARTSFEAVFDSLE